MNIQEDIKNLVGVHDALTRCLPEEGYEYAKEIALDTLLEVIESLKEKQEKFDRDLELEYGVV